MAVRLWITSDFTSLIQSLDDPQTPTDGGFNFPARLLTGKFGAAGNAYAHIRTFLQQLFVDATMAAVVTPVINGTEAATDGIAFSADSSVDGNSVQMQIPMYGGGVDFQVAIDITAHTGALELGGAEMWLVPRRQKPL